MNTKKETQKQYLIWEKEIESQIKKLSKKDRKVLLVKDAVLNLLKMLNDFNHGLYSETYKKNTVVWGRAYIDDETGEKLYNPIVVPTDIGIEIESRFFRFAKILAKTLTPAPLTFHEPNGEKKWPDVLWLWEFEKFNVGIAIDSKSTRARAATLSMNLGTAGNVVYWEKAKKEYNGKPTFLLLHLIAEHVYDINPMVMIDETTPKEGMSEDVTSIINVETALVEETQIMSMTFAKTDSIKSVTVSGDSPIAFIDYANNYSFANLFGPRNIITMWRNPKAIKDIAKGFEGSERLAALASAYVDENGPFKSQIEYQKRHDFLSQADLNKAKKIAAAWEALKREYPDSTVGGDDDRFAKQLFKLFPYKGI